MQTEQTSPKALTRDSEFEYRISLENEVLKLKEENDVFRVVQRRNLEVIASLQSDIKVAKARQAYKLALAERKQHG